MYLIMQKFTFICVLFMIVSFSVCEGKESFLSSVSAPCIQGVNLLTGQEVDSEPAREIVHYERYQEGWNQLGKGCVFLAKGDFRIGKIKIIRQASCSSTDIFLSYELGMTQVCDGSEKKSIYRYTESYLLYLVEYYQQNPSGCWDLSQSEHLFWQDNHSSPRLISRVLENEKGEATLCYCFFYNEEGKLVEEKLIGNLSGECTRPCTIDKDGYPEMNGVESYGVKYVYSEQDPNLLIAQIEENGLKIIYQYNDFKQCKAIFREYQGHIVSRCFYFYGKQGFLEKAVIDEGQVRDVNDLKGVLKQQIIRFQIGNQFPFIGKPLKIENTILDIQSSSEEILYEIFFNYDEQGDLISMVDSQGKVAIRENMPNDCLLKNTSFNSPYIEMISLGQIWDGISSVFYSGFKYLQLSAHQTRMKWNAELKLPEPIAQALEKIGKMLLGGSTYLLMGSHFEETHVDSYGHHEISDKVRVTFINGILNTRLMMHESLDVISESHGGVRIHYVFRPTEGWTWDISRAVVIKTGFSFFGFRSLHSHLLSKVWKELIQEMGGIDGGGTIIHYAHSLGGSETDRARELLTPEEQKMIRVVTFGSATMIRNEGFQSVINIISVNDGVSSIFLEPLGHLRNYFDPETNIRLYGSRLKAPYWPADHLLNGATYGPIIQEMGEKFLEEFAPKINPNEPDVDI